MTTRPYLSLIAASAVLSACATPDGDYPSLAQRESERVSGTMAVPSAPYIAPAPATQTLTRMADIAAQARAAHAAFQAAEQATRARASAASGAAAGSERWSVAQVALADLQTHRSRSMIALADLDRIYIEIANQGESLDEIGAIRSEIEALVADEDRALDAMLAALEQ